MCGTGYEGRQADAAPMLLQIMCQRYKKNARMPKFDGECRKSYIFFKNMLCNIKNHGLVVENSL